MKKRRQLFCNLAVRLFSLESEAFVEMNCGKGNAQVSELFDRSFAGFGVIFGFLPDGHAAPAQLEDR